MRALNKHKVHLLFLLATIVLWGCERKEIPTHEELYTGIVPLKLDWQKASPSRSTLQAHVWGTHTSETQGDISKDTLFLLDINKPVSLALLEAEYTMAVWHDAANISFDGTQFSQKPDKDGYLSEPDILYAGFDKFQSTAQQENSFTIKLYPYTRTLAFKFQLDAQAEGRIKELKATLSGVASSKRLEDRLIGDTPSGIVAWEPKRETDTRSESTTLTYSCQKRLLGMQPGAQQLFTLTLYYTNGEQETIEQDLTSSLRDFNVQGEEENNLTLSAQIDFAGQAEASATIEDWKLGKETDLDADN